MPTPPAKPPPIRRDRLIKKMTLDAFRPDQKAIDLICGKDALEGAARGGLDTVGADRAGPVGSAPGG